MKRHGWLSLKLPRPVQQVLLLTLVLACLQLPLQWLPQQRTSQSLDGRGLPVAIAHRLQRKSRQQEYSPRPPLQNLQFTALCLPQPSCHHLSSRPISSSLVPLPQLGYLATA